MHLPSILPIWGIIERDLRKYFRSPALIIVSLFLPLLQLVIIGYAFGGKVTGLSVALVDLDRGREALRLRERIEAVEANPKTFQVRFENSMDRALSDTREGRVNATLVIPQDYSRRVNQKNRPQLGLVLDNTDPFVVTTLTQKMTELLEAVNQSEVAPRLRRQVTLEVVEVFPYIEYIQYLLPGSVTLAIFVSALIGGGLLYIDDKSRGFHEGYLVSPVTKPQLVAGLILSGASKAAFAGTVVTIVGAFIAGVGDVLSPSQLVLLVTFVTLISFAFISFVSFLMVRVNDPVVPRATFGVLNTLLFFPSGAMYPVESFPEWLQMLAKVNPFTYAVHGLRAILLKNVGAAAILGDIAFLAVFTIACFLGVLILFPRRL